jgi:hypothetical protein
MALDLAPDIRAAAACAREVSCTVKARRVTPLPATQPVGRVICARVLAQELVVIMRMGDLPGSSTDLNIWGISGSSPLKPGRPDLNHGGVRLCELHPIELTGTTSLLGGAR